MSDQINLPPESVGLTVLAHQAAYLRDKMVTTEAFELLWRTSALLSWLAGLLSSSDIPGHGAESVLGRERLQALVETKEMRQKLDDLFFFEAQRQDCVRQMADCLAVALTKMAQPSPAGGAGFSLADLEALYVSEEQRRLHREALQVLT